MLDLQSETKEQSFRGDSFRTALHIHEGKAHCVPEVDAIYRVTEDGLWQGNSELQQNLLNANLFKDIWLYFDKQYPELLVSSYKFANRININLVENLLQIEDSETRNITLKKIENLQVFYSKYLKLIRANINKNIKLKHRIMLYFYNKLHKKLLKKGLI